MSSLFQQPKKHDFATVAGYVLSAASFFMVIYILSGGWL